MKLMSLMAAIFLVGAVNGCNLDSEGVPAEERSSGSASRTAPRDPMDGISTPPDGTAPVSRENEVFSPAVDPEVVFTGPLTTSEGSIILRYEPNSWYLESGTATLPSVGDLQWFLDTEDGCLAVDRSAFLEGTGEGHEITITPAPGGDISIGESMPLWIEGDWLIHDGCSKGDPIIREGQ